MSPLRPLSLCAALAVALSAAAADPKPKKAPAQPAEPVVPSKFTWDIPEIIEVVEVPGLSRGVNGVPVKLNAVRSKWKIEALIDHVTQSFANANLYMAPQKDLTLLTSDPQLHAFDPFRQIGFSVIFQANPDGTTTAILGEAHLSEAKPESGYFAPVFPDAQGVIQSSSEGHQLLAYATKAPQSDVEKFYREALPPLGYREVKPLKYRKGGEQITLSYHSNPNTGSGVVLTRGPYVEEGPVDPTQRPDPVPSVRQ